MRGLMGAGGVCLLLVALPVAQSAWEAQKADAVVTDLRLGRRLDVVKVRQAIADLDRAVAAEPVAGRYLARSELLGGAALSYEKLELSEPERTAWMRRARVDLERGLADEPASGIDWLRLAAMRQSLDGPSRGVLAPLFLSIDYAALVPETWPARLRMILDTWPYLNDAQKARLTDYMRLTWQLSRLDRRFFVQAIHFPADELIIRYFLRDEPGAQEELTRVIMHERH